MGDDPRPPIGDTTARPAPKLATEVAHAIVDDIVQRRLRAGARLAGEARMCAEHGVGRATVREALRLLEAQGVVTIRRGPGGGPRVAEITAEPMASNVALYLQRAGGTLREVMAVRLVLEPEIAAIAAVRRRGEAAVTLAAIAPGATVEGVVAAAADFHDMVAASTGNALFEALLLALHRITEPLARRLDYGPTRRAELLSAHRAVAEAIAAGDPDAARASMGDDLRAFIRHADTSSPALLDEPISWRLGDSPTRPPKASSEH